MRIKFPAVVCVDKDSGLHSLDVPRDFLNRGVGEKLETSSCFSLTELIKNLKPLLKNPSRNFVPLEDWRLDTGTIAYQYILEILLEHLHIESVSVQHRNEEEEGYLREFIDLKLTLTQDV